MKICSKCKQLKSNDCFHKRGDSDRLRSHCKECRKKESNEYQKRPDIRRKLTLKNQGRRKTYKLKRKYNLTFAQYMNLLVVQNGACAICGQIETKKKLNVDHNHNTNKVRGLLCWRCNTVLGRIKEDVNLLKNMINYLLKENAPSLKEEENVKI